MVGMVLAALIGDALGAPFEGHGGKDIWHRCGGGLPDRFVPGTHMGLRHAGNRFGMYTDDGNALLALAEALAWAEGEVDAAAVALTYARFFHEHRPERGLPDSAAKVLELCSTGANVRLTAMSSFCFGSFANGAAMRISPLAALAVSEEALPGVVSECCVSSHVHPEAVDAAVAQVRAVRILLAEGAAVDKSAFLERLVAGAATRALQSRLASLAAGLRLVAEDAQVTDAEFLETITDVGFQLYAPDAAATAVWFFLRYSAPEEALVRCVALGGDCDTTAAMLGAMLGAAHGTLWLPVRWFAMLENGEWGRDYAVALARRLAAMEGVAARCKEEAFAERPLHAAVARLLPVLAQHFGQEEAKVAERYDPAALLRPETAELWDRLFDLLHFEQRVRFDVATCAASFFCDRFRAVEEPEGLDRTRWAQLYTEICLEAKH